MHRHDEEKRDEIRALAETLRVPLASAGWSFQAGPNGPDGFWVRIDRKESTDRFVFTYGDGTAEARAEGILTALEVSA